MKLKKFIWLLPVLFPFGIAIPLVVTSCGQETTQQPNTETDNNNNNNNDNDSNTGGSNGSSTPNPDDGATKPPIVVDPNKPENPQISNNEQLVQNYKKYEGKKVKVTLHDGHRCDDGSFAKIDYNGDLNSDPIVIISGHWYDGENSEVGSGEVYDLQVFLVNINTIEEIS